MLSICSLSVSMSVVFPIPIVFPFRSDKGLTLDMLASESVYGGQFASSTQLIKPNYLVGFFWF